MFHRPDTLLWSPSKEHSHMVCPACSQLFKNPKYLPCYHSYCEVCLEKMQEHFKITCLKCRNEAVVPVGGVKDLPSNYRMDNLVSELVLNYKLENKAELRCEDCNEDNPLLDFCTNCKLFLCHFCTESHKYSKSCSSHNLISLTELKEERKQQVYDTVLQKVEEVICTRHVQEGIINIIKVTPINKPPPQNVKHFDSLTFKVNNSVQQDKMAMDNTSKHYPRGVTEFRLEEMITTRVNDNNNGMHLHDLFRSSTSRRNRGVSDHEWARNQKKSIYIYGARKCY